MIEQGQSTNAERIGIVILLRQLLLAEKKFLFGLRVTEARLERYKSHYIDAGMVEEKFFAIYKAIAMAIKVARTNVDILHGLENFIGKIGQKTEATAIEEIYNTEKANIRVTLNKFLSAENIAHMRDELLSAANTSWVAIILPAEVREQDKALAYHSSKQYQVQDVNATLLHVVCKGIATHIIEYVELFNAINLHGLNLDLGALNAAVELCNKAYSTKLEHMDKINLDATLEELGKILKTPFYDRAKHRMFKEKRNEVMNNMVLYIKHQYRELKGAKLDELANVVVDLLIKNELAKMKVKGITFFSSFHKQFFDYIAQELAGGVDANNQIKFINGLHKVIAKQLQVDLAEVTGKAGAQAIESLAKKVGNASNAITGQ